MARLALALPAAFLLACTSVEPMEWPCRSSDDDGATQTYVYNRANRVIHQESTGGGFAYSITSDWKGSVETYNNFVGRDSADFDSTNIAYVDSSGRVIRRTYTAKGNNAGRSYDTRYTYSGDRLVSGVKTFSDGAVQQLSYEYGDGVLAERMCTDGSCDVWRFFGADPWVPDRIEQDSTDDGTLDSWTDYERDQWGFVTVEDMAYVQSDGEHHLKTETTRRFDGAPEREVSSGDFARVRTYELCSAQP